MVCFSYDIPWCGVAHTFEESLRNLFETFLENLEDDLFRMSSENVASHTAQEAFDLMVQIRKRKKRLTQTFRDHIRIFLSVFADLSFRELERYDFQKTLLDEQTSVGKIALLEEDDVEAIALALSMHERGMRRCRKFHAVESLLAKLKSTPSLPYRSNPVSPYAVGIAFLMTIEQLSPSSKMRIAFCKWFEQYVIDRIDDVYDRLGTALLDAGVPSVEGHDVFMRRTESVPPSGTGTPSPHVHPARADTDSVQDLAQMMQWIHQALRMWRGSAGVPSIGDVSGVPLDEGQLCNLIDSVTEEVDGVESIADLKYALRDKIRSGGYAITHQDEDAMDVIAFIFDFFLQNEQIASEFRDLIAVLQIPYLKMTLRDRTIISDKNHPARLFLNRIGQIGLEMGAFDDCSKDPVYLKLRELVMRLSLSNPEPVEAIHAEFEKFLNDAEQKSRVREYRAVQILQTQEKIHEAKIEAGRIIHRMLSETTEKLSRPIERFLMTIWKDNLALGYLSRTDNPDYWESKQALNEFLFFVLGRPSPKFENANREDFRKQMRALSDDLKELVADDFMLETIIRSLNELCEKRVRLIQARKDQRENEYFEAIRKKVDELQAALEKASKEYEQAEASEIESEADDIGDERILSEVDESAELYRIADPVSVERAKSVKVGDWLRVELDGKSHKAKVAWISQVLGKRFLIDRNGNQVAALSLPELARGIHEKTIEILDIHDVPLIDRALSTLMNNLKGMNVDMV